MSGKRTLYKIPFNVYLSESDKALLQMISTETDKSHSEILRLGIRLVFDSVTNDGNLDLARAPDAEMPLACTDEKAAVELLEFQRWVQSPRCARCESANVYQMKDRKTGKRNKRYLWKCRDCKKQYSVRTETIFQGSHAPLKHWCRAFWEIRNNGNISARHLRHITGVDYHTALHIMRCVYKSNEALFSSWHKRQMG